MPAFDIINKLKEALEHSPLQMAESQLQDLKKKCSQCSEILQQRDNKEAAAYFEQVIDQQKIQKALQDIALKAAFIDLEKEQARQKKHIQPEDLLSRASDYLNQMHQDFQQEVKKAEKGLESYTRSFEEQHGKKPEIAPEQATRMNNVIAQLAVMQKHSVEPQATPIPPAMALNESQKRFVPVLTDMRKKNAALELFLRNAAEAAAERQALSSQGPDQLVKDIREASVNNNQAQYAVKSQVFEQVNKKEFDPLEHRAVNEHAIKKEEIKEMIAPQAVQKESTITPPSLQIQSKQAIHQAQERHDLTSENKNHHASKMRPPSSH